MKKGKRQSVLLSALVLLMALLCLVYFILQKYNNEKADNAAEGAQNLELYTLSTNEAKKLSMKGEYGTITFVREGDTWKNETEPNFPVDQSKVKELLGKFETIDAESEVVKECDDLGEYGLDSPSLVLYMETEEGVSAEISLGDEVPVKGGYYALVDGGTTVYIMESSYYTAFHYKENYFMETESGPVIDETAINYFLAKKADGSYFEAEADKDGIFQIKGAYPEAVAGETSALQTLFSNYTAISYGDVVTYHCEDASQYGIDKNGSKLMFRYTQEISGETRETSGDSSGTDTDGTNTTEGDAADAETAAADTQKTDSGEENIAGREEEKTYTLYIGNSDGEGNYYVQPKGSSYIYLCDEDTINGYLTVDAFSCVSPYLLSDTMDTIKSIAVRTQKGKAKFTVSEVSENTKKEKKADAASEGKDEDDEASESVSYEVKRDGKKADYQKFVSALTNLQGLQYAKEIETTEEEQDNSASDRMVGEITVKTADGNRKLTFLTYDGNNYYRVINNGQEYFLVEKKEVDKLLSVLLKVK